MLRRSLLRRLTQGSAGLPPWDQWDRWDRWDQCLRSNLLPTATAPTILAIPRWIATADRDVAAGAIESMSSATFSISDRETPRSLTPCRCHPAAPSLVR